MFVMTLHQAALSLVPLSKAPRDSLVRGHVVHSCAAMCFNVYISACFLAGHGGCIHAIIGTVLFADWYLIEAKGLTQRQSANIRRRYSCIWP
jgi:hypothetical protein